MMQVEEYEDDSLGEFLFDVGVAEEQVRMWEHAERMIILGEGLWDRYQELREKSGGVVPHDVGVMIRRGFHEGAQYEGANLYMQMVVDGEADPDDPEVTSMVELGMEAARSSYAWRATAIEVWTAKLSSRV